MSSDVELSETEARAIGARVKGAVLWRSGSQILAQLISWAATFLVIRLLEPEDYGLFAMTQVVITFLGLMSGYGFANALVRSETIDRRQIAQVFGMLILLNGSLAAAQIALAPAAAAYFRQPLIAELLTVQAILYAFTPFTALGGALLGRKMNFKRQAQVDLLAAMMSAATGIACASLGFGVWTLVFAPMAMFATRAVGVTIAARSLIVPSFRFGGAGPMFRYGSAMIAVQLCWFVQSQTDVFIAGRALSPYDLGLYTTALFLAQILAAKFVPPLNDVAFAAYSRIQHDRAAVAQAFLKKVRLIMLIALPFYLGLAAAAEPLVLVVLGDKWAGTIHLVRLLAFAMPFMTLQIVFGPATNALDRPDVSLKASAAGALILPVCFLFGVRFGTEGMAFAWLAGFPLFLLVTALLSLPVIGIKAGALARAVLPGLAAASAMMLLVAGLDSLLPPLPEAVRLATLVLTGAAAYVGLLFLFARPVVEEVIGFIRAPAAA